MAGSRQLNCARKNWTQSHGPFDTARNDWRRQSVSNLSLHRISLVAGKNTGNFPDSERFREFQRAFTGQNQKLTAKFPSSASREFKGKNRELNSPNRVALL
jgi:hypothetical protein